MTIDNSASAETYDYFLQEATELLQTMDDELQDLAESFGVQKVHNLMRATHTLKGAAASVGLDSIKEATHSLEDIFKALCHQDTVINVKMEGLIFDAYGCLKLLMSAQLAGAQVDEADITDRMMGVVAQLQELLGDRFGQEGYLPTSAELGFDMTQSIFEVGVMQRLDLFEAALVNPDAEELLELMRSQADVFVGLAESLDLPGFAAIAQTTQTALLQNPDSVLEIAPIALANYQAAQSEVLAGDRTSGGRPSEELEQFTQPLLEQNVIEDFALEDLSTFTEPESSTEQLEAPLVDEQTSESDIDTLENNWIVRLLKPPICPTETDSELNEPALTDLVPDQLGLLDLPDETIEATFSEAIAFLKSADFNDECELIPVDLHEADLALNSELEPEPEPEPVLDSQTIEAPDGTTQTNECSSLYIPSENVLEVDIPEADLIEADLIEASSLEANLTDIELPTDSLSVLEFLPSEENHLSVEHSPVIWPDDWPDIELPTPNFSAVNDTESNSLDRELVEAEPSAIKLQHIERSKSEQPNVDWPDIELPIIEPLGIDLSDIELPDADTHPIELFEAGKADPGAAESLPDLSFVFNLEGDRNLDLSLPTDAATFLSSQTLSKPDSAARSAPASTAPVARTISKNQNHQTTLRIGVDSLDQLTQSMGKLLTQQNRQSLYNEQLVSLVKQLLEKIAYQQKQLDQSQNNMHAEQTHIARPQTTADSTKLSTHFDALELDQYSDAQLLARTYSEALTQQLESTESIEYFVRHSSQTLNKQKRLLSGMREILLEARMLPLDNVFQRFPSAIKRLEAQQHKPAKLVITGGDVLVDKVIVDKLYDPLLHLVRNAFDHGIESAKARSLASKPATGTITLEALQQGRHLVINVKDDGQGLNLEKIRQKAIAHQLITTNEATVLTPEQTTDLLFEPGFSTVDEVSHLSGRGVGLDAVRAQARSLQGRVTVSHSPKAGTCFTLQIPSSLTIAKLMLCEAANRTYALIADAIEHILIPTAEQIRIWKGTKSIIWKANGQENLIPVSPLADVLRYAAPGSHHRLTTSSKARKATATKPIILIRHNNSLIGIEADRLLGEQELAINALNKTLTPPAYLYGSSILPDGKLTLVLDSVAIAKTALDQKTLNSSQKTAADRKISPHKPQNCQKLALTIDDSITVRNSLAEALQKAGYEVIQARDGAEGLQQLQAYPNVDVILCDLEMPGMNGFEFLSARQQAPEIAAIPTIMLTSRDSHKHRMLAKELGAIAYLTKPFLAPQILTTVANAIETSASKIMSTSGESK